MSPYNHNEIEQKWRQRWDEELESDTSPWIFDEDRALNGDQPSDKRYLLDMFPYPSGSGLHVGHVEEKVALDIYARYLRMRGENVLMPTGYDSFGLPTENYALKNDITPEQATTENTANFDEQTKRLGISYDWSRKLLTSDPDYYKFTQWWFGFLYDRGLAYRAKQSVNWCPTDQTVLANEQVIDGHCERCDTEVVQKELEQWFFKITDYAQRLLDDLDKLDWPESTKAGQRNWIGRSEGIEIDYYAPKFVHTATGESEDGLGKDTTSKSTKVHKSPRQQSRHNKGRVKILLASTNKAKLDKLQMALDWLGLENCYELVTPVELGLKEVEVEEGDDPAENAELKARAYFDQLSKEGVTKKKIDIENTIVIGWDGALEIPDYPDFVQAKVKRSALAEDQKEADLDPAEFAELVQSYYQGLAQEKGKDLPVVFKEHFVAIAPDGQSSLQVAKLKQTIMREGRAEQNDFEMPLRAITKSSVTDKLFRADYSEEQQQQFWRHLFDAVAELVAIKLTAFTTRPDTNFGATFIVVAPDSEFVRDHLAYFPDHQRAEVEAYISAAAKKTERERQQDGKVKTGVFTGLVAINRLNRAELPVYVSDFVLAGVGTGVVVGVPGHDLRDFEFAKAKGLATPRVVVGPDGDDSEITDPAQVQEAAGTMVNSEFLDGLEIMEAKEKMMSYFSDKGWGNRVVNYRLRDWSVSRQRYWGSPIPVLYKGRRSVDENRSSIVVLNLHAYQSNPQNHYIPYLAQELEELSIPFASPQLPGEEEPKLEDWVSVAKAELKKLENSTDVFGNHLDSIAAGDSHHHQEKKLIVTARSLGCWAALKLAETQKMERLILVGPATTAIFGNPSAVKDFSERQQLALREFIGDDTQADAQQLDWKKVNNNVSEIVVFLSTTDPYIPVSQTKEYFGNHVQDVRIVTFRGAGHFGSDAGFDTFPELLGEITKPLISHQKLVSPKSLPVKLPQDADYRPQGVAPLGSSDQFMAAAPKGWQPEVDTMDTFVCSSWYFFRFLDPHNTKAFASEEKLQKFGPVDFYIGGAEHTVLHLLYSRFFTKVAYDAGLIDYDEPFLKLRHQGLIAGPDGRKMSKRWGNVINPNDVIAEFGADTLRMYEMFMGPLEQSKSWDVGSVRGVRRFLQRIWDYSEAMAAEDVAELKSTELAKYQIQLNKLIPKVESDIEQLKFNTAISAFMKFMNSVQENSEILPAQEWQVFLKLLFPFAPFLASELWERAGYEGVLECQGWPEQLDVIAEVEQELEFVVMVNGKLRDQFTVSPGITQEQALALALDSEKVQKFLGKRGQEAITKQIFVPDKLLNLVVKQ